MNGEPSVVRGALVIVLVGAALGMVYNGMALRSHPPHGIPWIAVKADLPNLEAMTDSIAGSVEAEPPVTDVAATSPPSVTSAPAHPDAGAAPATHRTPGGTPPAPAPGGAATPTAGSGEPVPSATSAPEPRRPVPPPFIPESDQPVAVQLATTQRFFAAHAALFIDARDAAEYEAGHIPGAVRLTSPEANTDPERMKALPVQGRPIICYCEGGECEASKDLARTLIDAGYKKVLVYMGGFPEWSSAGQPVEKGSAK